MSSPPLAPEEARAAARAGARGRAAQVGPDAAHLSLAARWRRLRSRFAPARAGVGLAGGLAVLAAAVCLQALLDGGWWLPRTILCVAAVVATGCLGRAVRLPAPLQPIVQAVVLLLVLTQLFARESAVWGFLPGTAVIRALSDLVAQGQAYSNATVPPAPFDEGLLLLVAGGVGFVAVAVDTLAAELDLPGPTLLPLASLYLVPWVIQDGSASPWGFALVALGWLGILSACQRQRAAQWSPDARPGSPGIGVTVALATTLVAAMAGGLATLRGPAGDAGLGAGSGSGTVSIDALVSLRRSLVGNDQRTLLTYSTGAAGPDYLRLAILEEFDGERWLPVPDTAAPEIPRSALGAQRYASLTSARATGALPEGVVDYEIAVGPLGGRTAPTPAGTVAVGSSWETAWGQRTGMPEAIDLDGIEGERFQASVLPLGLSPTQLRAASLIPGEQVPATTLDDPTPLIGDDLPAQARELVADAATPFDKALAIQRWFTTTGGFSYSTSVTTGAGEDALASFLEEKVGYCEQYAAAMALMARAVGIPSRVVVGFTQGSKEDDQWVVRGTDAHAWPELWMGSAGWVRFEPTPGAPTTRIPAYAAPTISGNAPDLPTGENANGGSASPGSTSDRRGPDFAGEGAVAESRSSAGWWWLGGVALLVLLAVPALLRLVRRRRRLRSADADEAYRELVDTLVDLRLGEEGATPRRTRGTVAGLLAADDVDGLAALDRVISAVERQRYAAPEPALGAGSGQAEATGRSGVGGDPAGRAGGVGFAGGVGAAGGVGGAGGVAVAAPAAGTEPSATRSAGPRAGFLAADVRAVRRALSARVPRVRRLAAALAPPSIRPRRAG